MKGKSHDFDLGKCILLSSDIVLNPFPIKLKPHLMGASKPEESSTGTHMFDTMAKN